MPGREKTRTFWNGWRAADILQALLIIGSVLTGAAVLRERQEQDRRDILRLLTAEEALAVEVREHVRADDSRQADVEARMRTVEKTVEELRSSRERRR